MHLALPKKRDCTSVASIVGCASVVGGMAESATAAAAAAAAVKREGDLHISMAMSVVGALMAQLAAMVMSGGREQQGVVMGCTHTHHQHHEAS